MHPLVGDISNLKDSEIESKVSDLTKKYFITSNPGIKAQIAAVLETYKSEISRRRAVEWQKMMETRDKTLDKLINIS